MSYPVNVEDFEPIARERLSQMAYDFYAGGAEDEITLRENREAFRRKFLRYRVLVDVSERDLGTTMLGQDLPFPVILAPTAMHKLAHPDGEEATARAAASLGALMTLSSVSTVPLEDVAAAAPGAPRWFQLYCYTERAVTEMLVKRAYASGFTALIVTVDVPYLGRRERDMRNAFVLPDGIRMANFDPIPVTEREGESVLSQFVATLQTPTLDWDDLTWLRSLSPMPIVLKGVVRADDAARAVDMGVEGIWVSNHGGRQLDGAVAPIDALAEIVGAVQHRAAVIVDGGVRRGTDALKALAIGADAVAIGRPQLWGLAADGENGVRRVLEMLRDELSLAMALCGCRSRAAITADLLA
ncbi:MAG: alpha-hydroxy-acid oxidizing protein [Actinobacteria bacterium]|nr:MAG: alpha-hydroxy-acid oxidizing protein [Actinomycetota bacterium]